MSAHPDHSGVLLSRSCKKEEMDTENPESCKENVLENFCTLLTLHFMLYGVFKYLRVKTNVNH